MYSVYAIYNPKNKKIYIGQCRDLKSRLELHNNKEFQNSYTARFDGKWILIYSEDVKSRKDALIREKQLKGYRGRQLIKSFIPE